MSRIGKTIIPVPQGVEPTLSQEQVVVKGPKGSLTVVIPKHVLVNFDEAKREMSVNVDQPDNGDIRALWGLIRQLLANAVAGVEKPFEKSLEFIGVGFRVATEGKALKMEVGFSHPVIFQVPEGIEATVEKNIVKIVGIDKQLVGETAARIRKIKPPEPYKGKGIKYSDEVVRRKAGKAASK
ncbi:50S ribosomal protein L6 [Patescibacteria group bacterium]|nr:50S ribosomal protein L6 [Patescibacteria group bacterium]